MSSLTFLLPENTLTLGGLYMFSNDIEGYYYKYGGNVSNTFNDWAPSFGASFLTNLHLDYAWRPGDAGVKKVTIDLYVDNVFNANYIPYEYQQLRSAKYGGNFFTAQAGAPTFVGISMAAKF